MFKQKFKSAEGCEDYQQIKFSGSREGKTFKWNRHSEVVRPPKHFEAVWIFSRSEEVLFGDGVVQWRRAVWQNSGRIVLQRNRCGQNNKTNTVGSQLLPPKVNSAPRPKARKPSSESWYERPQNYYNRLRNFRHIWPKQKNAVEIWYSLLHCAWSFK